MRCSRGKSGAVGRSTIHAFLRHCLSLASFPFWNGLACCRATDIAREVSACPNNGEDSVTRLVSKMRIPDGGFMAMDRGSSRGEVSLGYEFVKTKYKQACIGLSSPCCESDRTKTQK